MSKIHLHIEELSLPGYTPAERRAFVAALEKELVTRLTSTSDPRELQPEKQGVLRVTSPDLRPQSVAHSAIAGLSLGTGKERTK
jgi:hypothetical protein